MGFPGSVFLRVPLSVRPRLGAWLKESGLDLVQVEDTDETPSFIMVTNPHWYTSTVDALRLTRTDRLNRLVNLGAIVPRVLPKAAVAVVAAVVAPKVVAPITKALPVKALPRGVVLPAPRSADTPTDTPTPTR